MDVIDCAFRTLLDHLDEFGRTLAFFYSVAPPTCAIIVQSVLPLLDAPETDFIALISTPNVFRDF